MTFAAIPLLQLRIAIALLAQRRARKAVYMKAWESAHADCRAAYAQQYHAENSIKRIEYGRQWRAKHPDYHTQYAKDWAKQNPERARQKLLEWKRDPKNKLAIAIHASRSYRKHRERRIKASYIYYRKRCKIDPIYRMIRSFRTRIQTRIKKPNRAPMWELLGCNGIELRSHLETLFKIGMSWENYGRGLGKWVVDHIRPVSSFDMRVKEDQQQCWHFSNLQPLWEYDNLTKHAKTP